MSAANFVCTGLLMFLASMLSILAILSSGDFVPVRYRTDCPSGVSFQKFRAVLCNFVASRVTVPF